MLVRIGLAGAIAGFLTAIASVHAFGHVTVLHAPAHAPRAASAVASAPRGLDVASSAHKADPAPEHAAPRRPHVRASRGARTSTHRQLPPPGDLLGRGLGT